MLGMTGDALMGNVLVGCLLTAYTLASLCVVVHVISWLHLLVMRRRAPVRGVGGGEPVVTVQLPLYNEAPSVAGLLAAVAALDWPADRLEVQVLDDSTDHTPATVAEAVERLQAEGLDIHHIRRDSRAGFKAGALAAGLVVARGEVIAIFDADFRPEPGFLKAAIGWLDPDIGLVQARWCFTNRTASLLTRAQALHLDAHFALEQAGRSGGNLLMGFNGTAGVWRRACIEAAGGWEGDTLTEDLDLAYRAQLAGWKLRYVDDIGVDSELPEDLPAVRSQQHRWIRGGAQVARKLLVALWRSDQPLRRRIQGTAHLLASSLFLPVLLICVLTPLLPVALAVGPDWTAAALSVPGEVLRVVLVLLVVSYGVVCWKREPGWAGLRRLVRDFPVYLALATAICLHNTQAALLGWTGPTGTFVRTPKRGHALAVGRLVPGEVALLVWSWVGVAVAVALGLPSMALFVTFQALAFTALCALTLRPIRSA
ncbi:MAG: cellulose synthase/poly-beta-1,6-N-acetylglucosamine synthase-like glycosyltransferase [Myxococcota bacterium]|jgi:cellulose synthase/poly-beta-1,6-N-acetylglucosamine synthase-like glycosyltransferase